MLTSIRQDHSIEMLKGRDCPICNGERKDCRSSGELIHCYSHNDPPSGYQHKGLSAIGASLYAPSKVDDYDFDLARQNRLAREAIKAKTLATLPSLQARDRKIKAFPHAKIASHQNADLLRRGLTQTEINFALSKHWLFALQGGYGISAYDPVSGLLCGAQRANDDRDKKYTWGVFAGENKLKETGENPLAVWMSPDIDQSKPYQIKYSEGFLKSLVRALQEWRSNPQVIVIGSAGGIFGAKSLERVLGAFPDATSHTLLCDSDTQNAKKLNIDPAYRNLAKAIPSLKFADWGQWQDKSKQDCDETFGTDDFSGYKLRSPQDFLQFFDDLKADREALIASAVNAKPRNFLDRLIKPKRKRVEIQPDTNVLEFDDGDRAAVLKEAIRQKSRYILDISGTGSYKTTFAGNLRPSDYDLVHALYLGKDHRNPTVKEIERNYVDMPTRNNGMLADPTRKTPLGNNFVRHPKKGESPNISGNCHRADDFHKLAEKGYSPDDIKARGVTSDGQEIAGNPICMTCPMLHACKKSSGVGFGFRHGRMQALQNAKIRLHPDQFPHDSDTSGAIASWDEAGSLLKSTKSIGIDINQMVLTFDRLEDQPDIHALLLPIKTALKPLLKGEVTGYHGFADAEVREILPASPENLDQIIGSVQSLLPDASDIFIEPDHVYADDIASTVPKPTEAIKALEIDMKAEIGRIAIDRLLTESDAAYLSRLLAEQDKIKAHFRTLKVALKDKYQQDVKEAKQTAKTASRYLRSSASRDTDEQINNLLTNWLIPFLKVWGRIEPGAIRISNKKLIITQADDRARSIASKVAVNLFMDATMTPDRLAILLGCRRDEILVIRQRMPKPKNLRIIQITGLGKCGKQRSDALQARINFAADKIRDAHGAENTATIDFKKYQAASNADGWWFNHSRGSNEFQTKTAMIFVGLPHMNYGAFADEYLTLRGNLEGFDAYYQQLTDAEIIQGLGRLRANLRSSEQLTAYLMTSEDLPPEFEAQQIEAGDLSADCLGKSDAMRLRIEQTVRAMHKAGKALREVTQQAVADFLGVAKSTIQYYWAYTKMLLEIIYSVFVQDSNPDSANDSASWSDSDFADLAKMFGLVDDLATFLQLARCYPLNIVRRLWRYFSDREVDRLNLLADEVQT